MSKDLLPTNDNQENVDQIHADNEIKRIGFALNVENKIIFFSRVVTSEKCKAFRDLI
jgi:hypothetical protein